MEQVKFSRMTMKEVMAWYEYIKPIKRREGKYFWVKRLDEFQIKNIDFRYVHNSLGEISEPVAEELSILADVKMVHQFNAGAGITITVDDIIRQIPRHLLKKTIAFEVVYDDYPVLQRKIFQEEFDEGFYVSVVRLYQKNDESNDTAPRSSLYPEEFAAIPLGMTPEEFQKLKEVSEYMFQRGLY